MEMNPVFYPINLIIPTPLRCDLLSTHALSIILYASCKFELDLKNQKKKKYLR